MKKTIACICILFGVLGARAEVVTNYVYIVSNIFNNVYTESIVTQKVKSSHTDFYYTNYVSVVTNVYLTTFRTNLSVNVDVSQSYVNAASNAASNASSFASESAASATAAGSSASTASSAASRAAASAASASSAASDGLQRINERINWFDQHSGETITMLESNVTVNVNVNAQDYSFTYTNAVGQAFDYVTVHPYGANGGATVSARSSGAYNTVKIRAWPRPRPSGSGYWWDFSPAYVDYDDKGMRLQYLPDTTTPILYVDGNGDHPNKKIVPEYFYWQSGYIYFKVRVWEDGVVVAWCLTRYKWDDWPNTIGYGGNNGTAMTLVDREGYGSSDMGTTLAYFYSKTRTDSADVPLEFPMSASPSCDPTIEWMRTGASISEMNDKIDAVSRSVSTDRILHYKRKHFNRYVIYMSVNKELGQWLVSKTIDVSADNLIYESPTRVDYYSDDDVDVYAERVSGNWRLVFRNKSFSGSMTISMGDGPDDFPHGTSNEISRSNTIGSTTFVTYFKTVWDSEFDGDLELDYFVSSDFNVYDARTNVIGRLVLDSCLSSLSNWVETVFQKR